MQHNSFGKQDLLLSINRHPLVQARRDPHRNVGRTPGAQAGENQFLLEGAWAIQSASGHPAEQLVADDLRDFLGRLDVAIDPQSSRCIRLEIGATQSGFEIEASSERIELRADDAANLWAGLVHLENEMRTAGGPILRYGETMRTPAWEIQICPPTWGSNFFVPDVSAEYLGDDAFHTMAHHGVNGMLLYGDFLAYATGTRFPELEHPDALRHLGVLREAAQRALNYGIRFYYCAVSPKLPAEHPLFERCPGARGALLRRSIELGQHVHCLCSSDPDALAFHAEVMGRLFAEVPELGGLIAIVGGESYYHCFMLPAHSEPGETNCPKCGDKLAEDVVANFIKVTADAVHAAQPHAHIMVWPYSAHFWAQDPEQLAFIDRLPDGAALLSEVDKDQLYQKDGYTKAIWDYSVDYDGCSDRVVAQALRCEQTSCDLFIKTETAHGIELLHLPYVPCIGRSGRKWQSVRALRPRGVLQRWGFVGLFNSVAERIGYQACWNPHFAPQKAAEDVAAQLMGEAAPQVVRAWNEFDRAVGHIPLLILVNYYIGPMFLGPAHPLPVWDGETPDAFRGHLYYLAELEATFSDTYIRRRDDLTLNSSAHMLSRDFDLLEAEFAQARDLSESGWQVLQAVDVTPLPPHCRAEVEEQQAIGEYLYRTFRTTFNTLRFIRLKEAGVSAWVKMAQESPPLTAAEEQELGQRIAQGDEGAYKKIVEANLRLVVTMAQEQLQQSRDESLTLADLIQEGNLGLMDAARQFDPALGQPFSTYASSLIRQAMSRATAGQAKTSLLGYGDKTPLIEVACDELENTVAARRIYEAAPWLNHKLRLDVGMPDSLDIVDEKIRFLREFVQ